MMLQASVYSLLALWASCGFEASRAICECESSAWGDTSAKIAIERGVGRINDDKDRKKHNHAHVHACIKIKICSLRQEAGCDHSGPISEGSTSKTRQDWHRGWISWACSPGWPAGSRM